MRAIPAYIGVALLASTSAWSASLGDLQFMAGCWTTPREAPSVTRECFTAPQAGLMQGSSQTIKNGATTFWEFAVIEQSGDVVSYTPFLKGKRSVSFTATRLTAGEVVFENPAHDFPKKIIYRKTAHGLEARVEGATPSDPATEIWSMIPQ